MKTLKISIICIMLAFVLISASCGKEDPGNSPIVSGDVLEIVTDDNDSLSPANNAPLSPAEEINRGGEEYDYTGWVEVGPDPDIGMMVDEDWITSVTQWTDSQNIDARLFYRATHVTISPKEAILEKFGSVIDKGGSVEYGEFSSKYLAEAYYCKHTENGYISIELYAFCYPKQVVPYESQYLLVLYYENRVDADMGEAALDEDAFWKIAQSLYVTKGYGEGGEYVPYIPEVDGENTSDGIGY